MAGTILTGGPRCPPHPRGVRRNGAVIPAYTVIWLPRQATVTGRATWLAMMRPYRDDDGPGMSDERASAARPAGRSRLRGGLGREAEQPVGARRERDRGDHGADVQRPVDVRERQLRAWHGLVAHLGGEAAGVDDEQHQVTGHVAVVPVRRAGDL